MTKQRDILVERYQSLRALTQEERNARDQQNLEQAKFQARRIKIQKICKALDKLHAHGAKLLSDESELSKEKGRLLQEHAKDMKNYILPYQEAPVPFPPDYHRSFLNRLHAQDQSLHVHRDGGLKIIFANIALFLLGACGIVYLPALVVHKLCSCRYLFFSNTASDELVDHVAHLAGAAQPPVGYRSTEEEILSLERELSESSSSKTLSSEHLRADWYMNHTYPDPILGTCTIPFPM